MWNRLKQNFLTIFISGICVGAADIVPGISGGTVAFIIGIYEELLTSIATLNFSNFSLLFQGKIRSFFNAVSWQFLLFFLGGVSLSFITFAKLFTYLLSHEVYRSYLYASFMGLVLGSVIFCSRTLSSFRISSFFSLLCGAVIAFALSGGLFTQGSVGTEALLESAKMGPVNLWIVSCGMMAVSAMLLPGISGSYLLTVIGMYGVILGALVDFLEGIKEGLFDMSAFQILFSMAIGIALGAILFSRVAIYLLAKHRDLTISMLIGFMIGAGRAIWPFWTYEYKVLPFKLASGPQLIAKEPFLPSMQSPLFLYSCTFFVLGFALVLLIEFMAKRSKLSRDVTTELSEKI